MPSSAAEVAQHLLEFGVTDPGLPAELVPLLLALGLSKAAVTIGERLESPEDRPRLVLSAADQAVLDPKRAPTSMPEITEGSALIRAALEAVEAGDEAGALDRLRSIARNSPFADWRYFVRAGGLAPTRRRTSGRQLGPARCQPRGGSDRAVPGKPGQKNQHANPPGNSDLHKHHGGPDPSHGHG